METFVDTSNPHLLLINLLNPLGYHLAYLAETYGLSTYSFPETKTKSHLTSNLSRIKYQIIHPSKSSPLNFDYCLVVLYPNTNPSWQKQLSQLKIRSQTLVIYVSTFHSPQKSLINFAKKHRLPLIHLPFLYGPGVLPSTTPFFNHLLHRAGRGQMVLSLPGDTQIYPNYVMDAAAAIYRFLFTLPHSFNLYSLIPSSPTPAINFSLSLRRLIQSRSSLSPQLRSLSAKTSLPLYQPLIYSPQRSLTHNLQDWLTWLSSSSYSKKCTLFPSPRPLLVTFPKFRPPPLFILLPSFSIIISGFILSLLGFYLFQTIIPLLKPPPSYSPTLSNQQLEAYRQEVSLAARETSSLLSFWRSHSPPFFNSVISPWYLSASNLILKHKQNTYLLSAQSNSISLLQHLLTQKSLSVKNYLSLLRSDCLNGLSQSFALYQHQPFPLPFSGKGRLESANPWSLSLSFIDAIEPILNSSHSIVAIVVQDSSQLRATGGSISDLYLLTLEKGSLVALSHHRPQQLDLLLNGFVEPPADLKSTLNLSSWLLQDSNWSVDSRSAAQNLAWFLSKEALQSPELIVFTHRSLTQSIISQVLPHLSSPNLDFNTAPVLDLLHQLNPPSLYKLFSLLSQDLLAGDTFIVNLNQTNSSVPTTLFSGHSPCKHDAACLRDFLFLNETTLSSSSQHQLSRFESHQLNFLSGDISHLHRLNLDNPGLDFQRLYLRFVLPHAATVDGLLVNQNPVNPSAIFQQNSLQYQLLGLNLDLPPQSNFTLELSYSIDRSSRGDPYSFRYFYQPQRLLNRLDFKLLSPSSPEPETLIAPSSPGPYLDLFVEE